MSRSNGTVLIVDDEVGFRDAVMKVLAAEGHEALSAGSLAEAREVLAVLAPDVLLLDLRLPDGDGVELLRDLPALAAGCIPLILTAHASLASAIDALRLGACDYLEKPLRLADLVARVEFLITHRALARENAVLRSLVASRRSEGQLTGHSAALRALLDQARRFAERGRVALITGESGVGKEEVARYVHAMSPDRDGPFVPVNLAALQEPLAEAQIFGHTRGAFTGAVRASDGLARAAAGGTLFLDEVTEASLALQAKLLRLVDRSEVLAVGATRPVRLHFRLLAATNREIANEVDAGRFREDLYHRLNVVQLRVPPLRDRRDGIPMLATTLLASVASEMGVPTPSLAAPALRALVAYSWPGNVRELRNVLERALILGGQQEITLSDLPDEVAAAALAASAPMDLREATLAFERAHIDHAIEACGGDRREAARLLGIGLSTLYRRLEGRS